MKKAFVMDSREFAKFMDGKKMIRADGMWSGMDIVPRAEWQSAASAEPDGSLLIIRKSNPVSGVCQRMFSGQTYQVKYGVLCGEEYIVVKNEKSPNDQIMLGHCKTKGCKAVEKITNIGGILCSNFIAGHCDKCANKATKKDVVYVGML